MEGKETEALGKVGGRPSLSLRFLTPPLPFSCRNQSKGVCVCICECGFLCVTSDRCVNKCWCVSACVWSGASASIVTMCVCEVNVCSRVCLCMCACVWWCNLCLNYTHWCSLPHLEKTGEAARNPVLTDWSTNPGYPPQGLSLWLVFLRSVSARYPFTPLYSPGHAPLSLPPVTSTVRDAERHPTLILTGMGYMRV